MALLEEEDSGKNSQKCTVNVQKTAWAPFFIVPMSEMNNELEETKKWRRQIKIHSIHFSFVVLSVSLLLVLLCKSQEH